METGSVATPVYSLLHYFYYCCRKINKVKTETDDHRPRSDALHTKVSNSGFLRNCTQKNCVINKLPTQVAKSAVPEPQLCWAMSSVSTRDKTARDLQRHLLVDLGWERDDNHYWLLEIDRSLNNLAVVMRRHLDKRPPTSVLKRIGNVRNLVIFNRQGNTGDADLIFGFGIVGCRKKCSRIGHKQRHSTISIVNTRCRGFSTRTSWTDAGTFIFQFSIR